MSIKQDADTKIVAAFGPADLDGGNADGDWVSLADHDSLTAVVLKAAGAANRDPSVSLRQARDNTGTGAKAVGSGQWYVAEGDDVFEAAAEGDTGAFEADGDTAQIARCEITSDQLDTNGGYGWVSVRATRGGSATSTAMLASAVYVLRGARIAQAVPLQPSAT